MHDLGQLAQVAPGAASRRSSRVGLFLLFGAPDELATPHGQAILASLRTLLQASGIEQQLRLAGQHELLARLPPNVRAKAETALRDMLNPPVKPVPEYRGITGETAQGELPPGHIWIDPATGQPPGPDLSSFPTINGDQAPGRDQLPDYDSDQAKRIRRADRQPQAPVRMTGDNWSQPFGQPG